MMLRAPGFVGLYLDRLKLSSCSDWKSLPSLPSLRKLQILQERHLEHIPFENLSQHGCSFPATLNYTTTANKILNCSRGGFCFELNLLFASLLQELGYDVTTTVAHVWADGVFKPQPSHCINIVRVQLEEEDTADGSSTMVPYFCDVGFGEPSLHPLDYTLFDAEQVTPEGMRSKLVRENDDTVIYCWYKNGTWVPRLRWSYSNSLTGCGEDVLAHGLAQPLLPSSPFAQKVIVTRLTRTEKRTCTGLRLKVTRPRFPLHPDGPPPSPHVTELSSAQEARRVLQEQFGMPLDATEGLCFDKSRAAPLQMWDAM